MSGESFVEEFEDLFHLLLIRVSTNSAVKYLKPVKTKQVVLSTNQLVRVHDLSNQTTQLEISNRQLERVSEKKLLGVKLQENLKWNDHVEDVANAPYGVLRTLRKLKHVTNFNLRKRLAELLVLSRLDFFTLATIPNEAPSKN